MKARNLMCVLGLLLLCITSASAAAASNSLTWRVKDEKAVFGYIVYRAEHREGPFRRVNAEIIRRHREVPTDQYRFDDRSAETGKTYYYFIDVISEHGRKQRLSGVRSKIAR